MATTRRTTVELAQGRRLVAEVAGPEAAPAVVFHHGTPGSSWSEPRLVDAVVARGWRYVAPTRAGYGESTRDEGRDVAAVAADTERLCDHLGAVRFATVGWSGGGPHALACAAAMPERCVGAVTVAGVAPYVPEAFDWTEGMGPTNVEEFRLSLEDRPRYHEMLAEFRTALLAMEPEKVTSLRELFGDLVSDADEAAADRAFCAYMVHNAHAALHEGIDGWIDDDDAFTRPWGFGLDEVEVPVVVLQGDHDLMVPPAHAEWLGRHVPGAQLHRFGDEGHLSLIARRPGAVLDALAAVAGSAW